MEADILFCLCNIMTLTWEQKSTCIYLGPVTALFKKSSEIPGRLGTYANSRQFSPTNFVLEFFKKKMLEFY